jgi:hypothetical protein
VTRKQLFGRKTARSKTRNIMLVCLPTAAALGLGALLWAWHPKALVRLDLVVDSFSFEIARGTEEATGPEAHPSQRTILDDAFVSSLAASGFKSVHFTPEKGSLQLADSREFDLKAGKYPESAWRIIDVDDIIAKPLSPALDAQILLLPDQAQVNSLIKLDSLRVSTGSRVTIALLQPSKERERSLSVTVAQTPATDHQEAQEVSVPDRFQFIASQCTVSGSPDEAQTVTYRTRLSESNKVVAIVGSDSAPLAIETARPLSDAALFTGSIPVRHVSFDRQSHSDRSRAESTLVFDEDQNLLTFPPYKQTRFNFPESPVLNDNDVFYMLQLSFSPNGKGLKITLNGLTREVRSFSNAATSNRYDINGIDVIKHKGWLVAAIGFAGWSLPTTLAVLKFVKELKAGSI